MSSFDSRRTKIVAGAVGLAAVLGGGAYLVTDQVMDHRASTTGETGALAPLPSPAASSVGTAQPDSVPLASASSSSPSSRGTTPSPSSSSSSAASSSPSDDAVRKARDKAQRDGVALQRPLTAAGPEPGKVSERNQAMPNGSIRIITARFDLTGHRELLWAGDAGKSVGNARCTQKVRFSQSSAPTVQPNLLLCWRTSNHKSVATVLVNQSGHPSTAASVKVIDQEWAKLR
ncbi:hypothetical protein ACQP2F_35910 [Actinoplanes sp. CA-030573]|uniref:hypothetical protein n=1 Tax=Actinoplanes sp. CA-030573 TaxID=3239898 RepID=UPI003D8D860F